MPVGATYPSEWRTTPDPQTGRRVTQLTASPAEDYHLYFYNPTVTPNGQYLIFISERTGVSNLFRLALNSGAIVQLTDAEPARAEYWPFTAPLQGVGACLPAIGAGGQEVFYFVGNDLLSVNVETLQQRHMLRLPADRRPSMLNANAQGDTLVFATWDEALFAERARRAYGGEVFPDERFFQEGASTIHRLDAASGACETVLRVENFWINHVLIHPHNRNLIEFCHEYTDEHDRMWLLNTATGQYAAVPGQTTHEWYQHEFWSAAGERIYFHAGPDGNDDQGFCGWCTPDGAEYHKFYHDTPGRVYAHYNLHPSGMMVADGEAHPGCISRVRLEDDRQIFEPLCRHDSYRFGDDQRCHPHPSFTPDGGRVIFTSNNAGTSNIYMVDWE